MKANRLRWCLLFLLFGAVVQLRAQQSEADRKLLADVRAKAEKGDVKAQIRLGNSYYFGDGLAQDKWEAGQWYQKALAQVGELDRQRLIDLEKRLGSIYLATHGHIDFNEAAKWYRRAADHGDAGAQVELGLLYRGVYYNGPKDPSQAAGWFRKAAEQGNAVGQAALGHAYYRGEGLPKDLSEAAKWCSKAAEQGESNAQMDLGLMYLFGDGVRQDFTEAHKWLNLASGQGDLKAKDELSALEHRMTMEQIAEARRLARQFKPREALEQGAPVSADEISASRPTASGSGFLITQDGFLITNEHVIKEAKEVRLVTSAGIIVAKVVKVDSANDLALLKAEGKFASLAIASSRSVKMGSTVVTVGFPNIGLQGFAPKLAKGEIAALSGAQDDPRYFQISVPVQPGNSGGALVDEHGNVVGVVSAKLSAVAAVATSGSLPENVNYAVKSSFLLGFLESVPDVAAKLKEPGTKERKSEDVVNSAEKAAVLVLVY